MGYDVTFTGQKHVSFPGLYQTSVFSQHRLSNLTSFLAPGSPSRLVCSGVCFLLTEFPLPLTLFWAHDLSTGSS